MTRYVVKKYINAKSLFEAVELERNVHPDEIWKDEKQDDTPKMDAIGFRVDGSDGYYSPIVKKHAKKRKKKAA